VLVLGSGWGAHAFVSAVDHKRYRVQVLSPHGYRLNQPVLIHNFPNFNDQPITYFNPSVAQIQDIAVKEDSKTVQGEKGTYPYDYLVIATGSEAYDFKVKGVQEHCLMCKTDTDMKQIHDALTTKEDAIIMGAGPTGIELACKLESEGVQVRILEATPTLLPGFSEAMRARVTAYLANREISLETGSPVQCITKDSIVLKNSTIPYKNSALIWTCGIQPVAFVRQITGGGPLTVDPFLCYKKDVYALGDSVKGWPPTAQNAKQQGLWLAQHFNGGFDTNSNNNNNSNSSNSSNNRPYQYHEKGRLLDLTYAIFLEYKGIVWHIPYFLTPIVRWIMK